MGAIGSCTQKQHAEAPAPIIVREPNYYGLIIKKNGHEACLAAFDYQLSAHKLKTALSNILQEGVKLKVDYLARHLIFQEPNGEKFYVGQNGIPIRILTEYNAALLQSILNRSDASNYLTLVPPNTPKEREIIEIKPNNGNKKLINPLNILKTKFSELFSCTGPRK